MAAVVGIYARENGQGLMFSAEEGTPDAPDDDPPPAGPKGGGKPSLKVIK